jgi:hypothetical protein
MLETYAPELYPEVTVTNGVEQKHFGRVMMESAAQTIREAWSSAIKEVEAFPDDPKNLIEQRGRLRQVMLEIAGELGAADVQSCASDDQIIMQHVRNARDLAKEALRR